MVTDGDGLAKIAQKHPEVLDNLQEILNTLTVVKKEGDGYTLETPPSASRRYRYVIRLKRDNVSKTWLMTAMDLDISPDRSNQAASDFASKDLGKKGPLHDDLEAGKDLNIGQSVREPLNKMGMDARQKIRERGRFRPDPRKGPRKPP